jgi:hypothetical protein
LLDIVLMGLGIAKIDQYPVPHIFGDDSAKAGDGRCDSTTISGDNLA